ncbi:hypothetical protein MMPV_006417 [Pyropia vietnamensis]
MASSGQPVWRSGMLTALAVMVAAVVSAAATAALLLPAINAARSAQGDTKSAGFLHEITSGGFDDDLPSAVADLRRRVAAHAVAMANTGRAGPPATRLPVPEGYVATEWVVAKVPAPAGKASTAKVAAAAVARWLGHPAPRAVVLRPGTDVGACAVVARAAVAYVACFFHVYYYL